MGRKLDFPASHFIDNIDVGEEHPSELTQKQRAVLLDTLETMDPMYRTIIEMRLWEQLTFRQIARRLGYKSHSTVHNRYWEAIELLEGSLPDNVFDFE